MGPNTSTHNPLHVKFTLSLPALVLVLVAATFTSCLDEDGNFLGMDLDQTMTPDEAARTGTDMPRVAYLKSVTYLNKQNQTVDDLDHLEVRFSGCNESWCRASTDDCGDTSGFTYRYRNSEAGKTIQLDNFSNAPAISNWAEEGRDFTFTRTGTDIEISCADCPGVSPFGTEYDGKIVSLQAVR